ncbi:MAG: 50S ribosomal protein L23 [Candidatus Brockarchaeota archaeon]|nr:50S ribosomal protein L23 [Candidatus Brockarchaeota archaeon]
MKRETILHPVATEKAINMIESENKIVFMVDRRATKREVKRAVEELYGVKVESVNILVTPGGKKKAFVRLSPESSAAELSMKLKIL